MSNTVATTQKLLEKFKNQNRNNYKEQRKREDWARNWDQTEHESQNRQIQEGNFETVAPEQNVVLTKGQLDHGI